MAIILLMIQPVTSMMIIHTNLQLRNMLLSSYLLLAFPYSIYKFYTKHLHSTVSENGHLRWNFFDPSPIILVTWFFFFLFSFVYEQKWFGLFFGLISLLIIFINYQNDRTVWSVWCWSVNLIMVYYAVYLLVFLPFLEKMFIC